MNVKCKYVFIVKAFHIFFSLVDFFFLFRLVSRRVIVKNAIQIKLNWVKLTV